MRTTLEGGKKKNLRTPQCTGHGEGEWGSYKRSKRGEKENRGGDGINKRRKKLG